jgi:GT2 family glycosyltransferase
LTDDMRADQRAPRAASDRAVIREATAGLTVSIVTFNGLKWLPGCFSSLGAQTLPPDEILVFDNASSDGTVEWLRAEAVLDSRVVVEESTTNLGFAMGHNRNIFRAQGGFICLLNQDVELDEQFLEMAMRPFSDARIASVQGRLRRLGPDGTRLSVLDSTGLLMSRDRRVVARGAGEEDGPRHLVPGPVWGADGPAPVYRRSALLDGRLPAARGGWEVLDEDFFMYKEDVDLAWRLRSAGWRAWYEPRALAWHARGAGGLPPHSMIVMIRSHRTIPRWVKRISWRNHRLMQLKNETATGYLHDLPWILKRELLSIAVIVVADPRRLGAVLDFLRLAPRVRRKRSHGSCAAK